MANFQRWERRILRIGPVLGILALILAAACAAMAWRVLAWYDGTPMIDYPYINSYLSITSNVAATLIRFAIGGGLAIRWWRTALSARSVAYLHRQWKVGTSLLEVIKTPRGLGLVAIVIIPRALLIAVGPCLQRAVDRTQHPSVLLSVALPEHLPSGWAGTSNTSYGRYDPSELLDEAYHGFALNKQAQVNIGGCVGQCQLGISSPGIVMQESDCISAKRQVNLSDLSTWPLVPDRNESYILFLADFWTNFTDTPRWFGPTDMEPTQSLPVPPQDQETVAFYFTNVNMTGDVGTMYSKQCWIRSASSMHNLTVDSQGFVTNESIVTTLELNNDAPAGADYRLQQKDSTSIVTSVLTLSAFLQSKVYFYDSLAMLKDERGSLGSFSIIQDRNLTGFQTSDPTSQVFDMLNDVSFRAGAISGFAITPTVDSNTSHYQWQTPQRQITGYRLDPDGVVYLMKMRWCVIAASIQGFAILLTATLYWGWWQLGRAVSFSPIEIAKAFDAPLLQEVNTNAGAKDLLHDVGDVRIRYGAVRQRQTFSDEGKQDGSQSLLSQSVSGEPCDRLVFGLADETLRPYGGQKFCK